MYTRYDLNHVNIRSYSSSRSQLPISDPVGMEKRLHSSSVVRLCHMPIRPLPSVDPDRQVSGQPNANTFDRYLGNRIATVGLTYALGTTRRNQRN